MKRLVIVCAVVGLTLVGISTAQAASGGCQCTTPVAQAPAPAVTTAQAQPTNGYRTYSYQPGTYQPAYQPAPSFRSYNRSAATGFHSAGWKSSGGN